MRNEIFSSSSTTNTLGAPITQASCTHLRFGSTFPEFFLKTLFGRRPSGNPEVSTSLASTAIGTVLAMVPVTSRVISIIALSLAATACGTTVAQDSPEELVLVARQADDDRTLEEKVDTDGDGEMSDEEIGAYAQKVLLDFSECMRQNGYPDFTDVSLEDLTEGTGSGQSRFIGLMAQRGVTFPDGLPAVQLCGEDLSDLQTFAPQPSDDERAEQEAAVLEFAACMRSEGLTNWPDPDFAANAGNGYGPELLQEFDIQSDEVQDTIATCQAANSAAVDVGDSENEDSDSASDSTNNPEDTASTEPIDRTPISPVIEGDTSDLNVAEVARRLWRSAVCDGQRSGAATRRRYPPVPHFQR